MDEVLSSGSLRLIRDEKIRTGLLSLYAIYTEIAFFEEHMARDFDMYLYDPTFSSVPIQFKVANLDFDHESLLPLLEQARLQVEQLLQQIPAR